MELIGTNITVIVREILDHAFGCYLWPSSLVLVVYLIESRLISSTKVLELGAGIGLPGLLCAKMGAQVSLTDAKENTQVLKNLSAVIELNGLGSCKVVPLNWGCSDEHSKAIMKGNYDLIIGSDVFYEPSLFEDLIKTLSWILNQNPRSKFITAYQERSSKRTIDPLLDRYGLVGNLLRIHPSEFADKIWEKCKFYAGNTIENLVEDDFDLSGSLSCFIIEITLSKK